jgi:hypothetical protein
VATDTASVVPTVAPPLRQASTDGHLVELWLHGRSPHTRRAYHADSDRFLASSRDHCPR